MIKHSSLYGSFLLACPYADVGVLTKSKILCMGMVC